jgi:CBS domain-containing protein
MGELIMADQRQSANGRFVNQENANPGTDEDRSAAAKNAGNPAGAAHPGTTSGREGRDDRNADTAARGPDSPTFDRSAGAAATDTADPNFTAAHRDFSAERTDSGGTRMATGASGDLFNRAEPIREPSLTRANDPSDDDQRPVRDVMTADVKVCGPDTELYYVARMMADFDCGAIPVVDSTDTMKPIGIVTDRDIVVRAIAKNEDPKVMHADAVMSTQVTTINVDTPIAQCVWQMERHQVRRLIVTDAAGRVCGIVSQADIARVLPREKSGEMVREVSSAPSSS